MDNKKFNLWNKVTAAVVFAISAFTYLSTIEPSASFWDCGEFIASSYKLEVGHPPGNPVFQLIARVFTMFGDNMHAAVLINAMSALCSALTIFLLYLTIVFFAKRLVGRESDGSYSAAGAVAIFGSGAVGALAYCFSDTFWFSAVEGEVYAMSSLFTALVLWAMTRWYDVADEPYANRWIVLISFLMGISIGIHLLNLLAIPALVFMYYYRKKEDSGYSLWDCVKIMLVSVVILAAILFVVVPFLPKFAAYSDLIFVNTFGLPYNSGAVFFMAALLALCFWGLFRTLRKDKVFLNTALLCLTTIIVGFSLFSICVIRSSVKTPTNEYQPDNAFTLVRYLSREQYGKNPLLYGQYFDAPYDLKTGKYWAPLDGRYKKVDSPVEADYKATGKMLFPRMWNSGDQRTVDFYESYMNGKGHKVAGADHKKPTMGANLAFFFDYQLNWMYWRYFLWNFAGRQNDIHSPAPGNLFHGNWESGIKPLDQLRLGNQDDAPAILRDNKGKNHYFMLPLLLGLLGLFFQFAKDKRGCWIVFLMFFMTGIAVVIYLNQPPYQVRERDYAYAGSFYSFCIWIGFAVTAIFSWITDALKGKKAVAVASAATAACLLVPALMAEENWDDHDRSNRYTAVELARNYLNSAGKDGILVTHGDNDTFPLWYAQEVEDVRTDVRICNTSLLGTDWHIDQMKWAVNESKPLDLRIPQSMYLYGTNEYVYIFEQRSEPMLLSDAMKIFRHPEIKVSLSSGKRADYIPARKLIVPVNKENVLRYGILPASYADQIPESIMLEIPEGKTFISKPELFMLDLLSNYNWDRPISLLSQGGDINIGIKDYLMYDGYSSRFTPVRNTISTTSVGTVDTDVLYRFMTDVYKWDDLKRTDYYVDYQNLFTTLGVISVRSIFVNAANAFMARGENERAVEMLDKCQDILNKDCYPLETVIVGLTGNDYMVASMIEAYLRLGCRDKARALAGDMLNELQATGRFYLEFYSYSKDDFETVSNYFFYICDILKKYGERELAAGAEQAFSDLISAMAESAKS
ncbi:MAG: DUF2723 domain-containing protein [Bacteroidales bacterium]|nr:DUF2723 domain-containing protein [Candidatus Cryptobacteroides onthequi]